MLFTCFIVIEVEVKIFGAKDGGLCEKAKSEGDAFKQRHDLGDPMDTTIHSPFFRER